MSWKGTEHVLFHLHSSIQQVCIHELCFSQRGHLLTLSLSHLLLVSTIEHDPESIARSHQGNAVCIEGLAVHDERNVREGGIVDILRVFSGRA